MGLQTFKLFKYFVWSWLVSWNLFKKSFITVQNLNRYIFKMFKLPSIHLLISVGTHVHRMWDFLIDILCFYAGTVKTSKKETKISNSHNFWFSRQCEISPTRLPEKFSTSGRQNYSSMVRSKTSSQEFMQRFIE